MNNREHGSTYKLRQAAKNDLKEIGLYTLKNYGKTLRNKYLKGLEKHVVFYCIQNDFVEILAVLHGSMVPEFHL